MPLLFESCALDTLALLVTAATLFYYYMTSTFSYWKDRGVPSASPVFFFGSIKDMLTNKKSQAVAFQDFYNAFKENGYGGVHMFRRPVLLVTDPAIIKDMMVKNFRAFHDRGMAYDESFDPLSCNLAFLDGQKWKFMRSKLTPTFSSGRLKHLFDSVAEVADKFGEVLIQKTPENGVVDIKEVVYRFATDVIGSCVFGLQFSALESEDGGKFRAIAKEMFTPSKYSRLLTQARMLNNGLYKTFKLRIFHKHHEEFFTKLVKDTFQYRKEHNVERKDFMHYLMKIKEQDGDNLQSAEEMEGVEGYNTKVEDNVLELTDGVITAQAFIFFLAGFDTSGTTMTIMSHVLVEHPDVMAKLVDEVDAMYDAGELNYDALHKLTYMDQVISEVLRMYPPAPTAVRVSTEPYTMPDTGLKVEKGTKVFMPVYALHKDPEYFPEPDKFDPERFSPDNIHKIVPYSYIPFGGGPRVCIGKRFAEMEMKIFFSTLLRHFRLSKCEKTVPLRFDPRVMVMRPADGVYVKVERRVLPTK